jgi:hypothetical protein
VAQLSTLGSIAAAFMIHFTYNSVPELKPLSQSKRIEALRSAGRAFGRTPQFRRVWWFTIFMTFGFAIIAALLFVFSFHGSLTASGWIFTACLIVGYTIAFQLRMHYLRPHIRNYLAQTPNNAA